MEEGDITLKISDNYPVKVSVNASEIIPDTKFNSYGTVTRTKVFLGVLTKLLCGLANLEN